MNTKGSITKYSVPGPITVENRQWPDKAITENPVWCAVDLRDGNQALPNPMTPDQKMTYFNLLCDIGFKEIEVGFPSASQDDFTFVRELIEGGHIPDDVTISVLTQARPHLIEKTIEAIQGAKNVMVHFYVATSELHRSFVFGLEPEQVIEMAVEATKMIRDGVKDFPNKVRLEFSPEEFTDTDLDFAIDICNKVVETWQPEKDEIVVLNLPATVERRFPNEYADMIEEFRRRQKFVDNTVLSLHAHNDMGMGIASTMLSLKGGAGRVEGTLFGHGERTGNVDLVTCALNLQYLGIDTGLDFSKLPEIAQTVEDVTDIKIHPRHPYAGELVFTAFSGSHQDAIHKGYSNKDELIKHFGGWKVPYLHVDPWSLGRSFEKFIRINSQSGKGGIAYILEHEHHIKLPRWVQVDFASHVQKLADDEQKELSPADIWDVFQKTYLHSEPVKLINYWPRPNSDNPDLIEGEVHIEFNGEKKVLTSEGNGPISAFVHALKELEGIEDFVLENFSEGTRGVTAEAEAVCFIHLDTESGKSAIGAGFGNNIDQAAARATLSAFNRLQEEA